MKEEYQRVYAQIDLDALIRNVQHIKANMKQGVKLICVIKTDMAQCRSQESWSSLRK